MADAIRVSGTLTGTDKTLSMETGKLAQQSQGAVVASLGRTTVLATANAAKDVRPGTDFFPLTIDVEERAYAAGKIPGSFFRREGRPTEDAILTCRLTDRPLRPAFPDGFRNETQVVLTILGADMENPHDVLAINAASASLMISGIPFEGPIGAVRVAYSQSGEWIPHPTYAEGDESTFELVVAGRQLDNGDVAIMMVEAGGTTKSFDYYADGAPKVDEGALARGLEASKTWIKDSISLQRQLVASVIATRGPIVPMEYTVALDYAPEVMDAVAPIATPALSAAVAIAGKAERNAATDAAAAEAIAQLCGEGAAFAGRDKEVKEAVRSLTKKLVRKRIVEEGLRIDGRGPRDLRPLSSEVGVLPTAHGTGLFQRGETQVMNVCTMAMPRMNQLLDTLSPETNKYFLFHYNMAPWANGETGRVGSPKRREIGHGALAARALLPVLPGQENFNYALRLVAEVLSSNGSTSMASVCSGSLALMDAGVPIRAAVAGIAMGLVYAEGKYTTLTDILGAEDAFGDMDFKVAGTADAITALQLDTKIDGIPAEVLAAALDQAKDARMEILANMNACLAAPREEVAATAPKIITITIPMDKIGEVIGPKGKVINTIVQETGADIAVDDDGAQGIVTIGAVEAWRMEEAKSRIQNIVSPPMAEVGKVYPGRVVNITKFGAFVNILPGRDGLVHISKLGKGKRINNVEDVLTLGQEIEVVVEEIDEKGKVSLTPTDAWNPVIAEGAGGSHGSSSRRSDDEGGSSAAAEGGAVAVSFDDEFDAELAGELGDLGPGGEAGGHERNDRGGDRGGRGGDRGGRGGDRGGDRGGRRRHR
ncbi:MAG: polyribonucleotide nucleotidyltransferase [Acidimicrobiaceae bacterium]|nr:polyribonucleotide nucleotidyltransferase [Ilumatobacter sp.]MCB9379611.1 polyribonucleotide nucleotidyltransferase [Acidimicrobiaceae bacterium]